MSCEHPETIVDFHSADLLCSHCGLVFETISGEELGLSGTSNPVITQNKTQNQGQKSKDDSVFIQDLLHKMMLPPGSFQMVFLQYKKYQETQSSFKKLCRERGHKFKPFGNIELAAYSCYKVLKNMFIPRTMKEISHYSGIDSRILWKI